MIIMKKLSETICLSVYIGRKKGEEGGGKKESFVDF
jgi:hypothetical protein